DEPTTVFELKRGAGLLAGQIPARAHEADRVREALRFLELRPVSRLRVGDQRVDDLGEVRVRGSVAGGLRHELTADAAELARVEEDAAALRAFVDRHCALHAPEVTHQYDAVGVPRALVPLL